MKTKHTPCPWERRCSVTGKINIVKATAPFGEFVDIVCNVADVYNETEEDKANTTLIAAAPELFEALQNYTLVMERFLETMPEEFVVDLIAAAVVQGAHKQAKEAIKKATLCPLN